jgi:hypothetical protein
MKYLDLSKDYENWAFWGVTVRIGHVVFQGNERQEARVDIEETGNENKILVAQHPEKLPV